ncbi:hypothetical protein PRK78_003875 [Emydomyces testavorans]|uniref:Uncharacterized protein n=1 Tax=Emydomyces testavorans TaxID=2070801 RepID=A0AAF0IIZ3_9EURO|nr:hypothetical protein PRK78_003875 [Emydomyces testavorans]
MDECQKLTVASIWKFDPEAVLEIRSHFKKLETAGQTFCKYEQRNDVFTFDSHGIVETASVFSQLLTAIIDDEKDNDLLEKPKISRIVAPPPAHEQAFEPHLDDDEPPLIDTFVCMQEEASVSIETRYWQSKYGGVDCFLKLPYDVLSEVENATGAHIALETENKRIRVSKLVPLWRTRLIIRVKIKSLVTSSHVENILHVSEKDFRLRLCVYATLNSLAIQGLFVDLSIKDISQFAGMYVTVIETPDMETRNGEVPKRILAPPRPTPLKKGRSKLWADFKFAELGDVDNLPEFSPPKVRLTIASQERQPSPKVESLPNIAVEEAAVDKHRFLSREKVSLVDKWVTEGVEAGAVWSPSSEPIAAPSRDSFSNPAPALAVPGIKKRVAIAAGASNAGSSNLKSPASRDNVSTDIANRSLEAKAPTLEAIDSSNIAADGLEKSSTVKNDQSVLLVDTPQRKPWMSSQKKGPELIDISDCSNIDSVLVPKLPFNQEPLVPSRFRQETPVSVVSQLDSMRSIVNPSPFCAKSESSKPSLMPDEEKGNLSLYVGNASSTTEFPQSVHLKEKAGIQRSHVQGGKVAVYSCERLGISHEKEEENPLSTLFGQNNHGSPYGHSQTTCENGLLLGSERIIERLQTISEVETRVFCKTMRQQTASTNKRSSKAGQKAKKRAAIAEAWGTPVPSNASNTRVNVSEPSKWKKLQLAELKASEDNRIRDLYSALDPILGAVQCFKGNISLELQFGLILVHNVPKVYTDRAIDVKAWDKLFRPQHGLRGPSTRFMNILTSSGADIDYILTLKNNVENYSLFSENPSTRHITYEFHCQAKGNRSIVVSVDESGMTTVTRPETVLGAVNIHFPERIWDMRVTVKGSQEYSPGIDKEIDGAVEDLIYNLYVCPNEASCSLYFRLGPLDILHITKVLVRRSTRHGYLEHDHALKTHAGIRSRERNEVNLLSDNMVNPPLSNQDLYLQVTEVQNLLFGQISTDKSFIRARALSPEEMVENSRLWYEVSIVSPAVEKVFESNKNLPVGGCATDWQPLDLLGADADLMGQNSVLTTEAKDRVGFGGLGQMYRVASQIITQIDGVGCANSRSCIEPRGSLASAATRSNFAVTAVPSVGAPDAQTAVTASTARETFYKLDSQSTSNVSGVEEFW